MDRPGEKAAVLSALEEACRRECPKCASDGLCTESFGSFGSPLGDAGMRLVCGADRIHHLMEEIKGD